MSKPTATGGYPLPAYNFRVTVFSGGRAETVGFAEVSGLEETHDPVVYRDGLSFALGFHLIPGMAQPVKLSLRKGLTPNGAFLRDWYEEAYREPFSKGAKRNMTIDLCDERGHPVIRWQVTDAMPTRLEGPALNAAGNEVAVAAMELTARRLRVHHHL